MRFLLCSLESPGFLNPAMGLAEELKRRGHEVAFVADVQTASFLNRSGFQRIPCRDPDASSFKIANWFQPLSISNQVRHIEHALSRFQADALIGQSLTLGPLLVRERRGLPVALMGFCTYLWPLSDEEADEGRELSPTKKRLAWRHRETLNVFNQARVRLKMLPYEGGVRETPLLGDLFLLRSVPELTMEIGRLPDRVHLAGSCLWELEEADPELENWLARSGEPLVYAHHGRFFQTPSFWQALVEALGGMALRVAASTARMEAERGDLPEGFLARPYLPQGQILRSAQIVITSANTTAVLGALSAGVPSLLIPAGGEQPDVAEACLRAGVSLVIAPENATPLTISGAVRDLLDGERYRERAARLRSAFARVNGFDVAADLCERLARTGAPVLRMDDEAVRAVP